MTNLSGIVSLLFIAAAFVTSCEPTKQQSDSAGFPALQYND